MKPTESHSLVMYLIHIINQLTYATSTRDGNESGRAVTRPSEKRLRVEIRTLTCWVLGGYRVSIGFFISHVKTTLK
jgi:hypothetical protein